ncbi:small protein YadW, partial [Escherichia coli]
MAIIIGLEFAQLPMS